MGKSLNYPRTNRNITSQRVVTLNLMLLLFGLISISTAQYILNTDKFNLVLEQSTLVLEDELTASPDVVAALRPDLLKVNKNIYRFDFPFNEDYRIGLLVDPCRNLTYNCCVGASGTPVYEALISKNGVQLEESERVVQTLLLASDDVQANYRLVYEDGSSVPEAERRTADDEAYVDTSCTGAGVPRSSCQAKNYAFRPSSLKTPCSDNNFSLNAIEGCTYADGTPGASCVSIGYSQNAYIAQCKGDQTHCGTYLEIHQPNGSPYTQEADVIAEVLLGQQSISGYSTVVMPLTWMGNLSRVLCAYSETSFRAGSIVYVHPTAPVCCCPPSYSSASRLGSYQCPAGPFGRGAFATNIKSVAEALIVDSALAKYPHCHSGLDAEDRVMCSVLDPNNHWQYTRNCSLLQADTNGTYSSRDLHGQYTGVCPYYAGCGLQSNGSCGGQDSDFSFIGRVGKVVAYHSTATPPYVSVSFNDGRTAYDFLVTDVKLETALSTYELWWVQRTPSALVVQKRKGFNVTYPTCTFDPLYQQYFPYTSLDSNGVPVP